MSRHCNKDLKVLSIQAILVTLCQLWKWFTCWENFENHHPEKLTKISDICKEVICGGIWFYSQTILLLFTVVLFHSNLKEKVTSNEQKVKSNEQKVTSNDQKVTSNHQKLMNNEQKVTSKVVENRPTQDTSQKSQGKFFLSFLYTLFLYF